MRIITLLVGLLIASISFGAQIKVYTTEDCAYCHHLVQELKSKHIPFTEISGGKKYDSFPVTEVNGNVVYGDNITEILKLLKSENK